MKYVVIGCVNCEWVWLIDDNPERETAECPRCSKQYRNYPEGMTLFKKCDTREEAVQHRRELLDDTDEEDGFSSIA